jgi:hypothetical protein
MIELSQSVEVFWVRNWLGDVGKMHEGILRRSEGGREIKTKLKQWEGWE